MTNIIILEHNNPKEYILQEAKKRGYRIIMIANRYNPMFEKYINANDVIITDVFDIQTVLDVALSFVSKNKAEISAVGTSGDDLLVVATDLAVLLDCPNIGSSSARKTCCNKLAMRLWLNKSKGINQPIFGTFNIFKDEKYIFDAFVKPCVVKPIFGTSSHGVLMIKDNSYDYGEVIRMIKSTVNRDNRESFKRFSGDMVIEEYIPGKMISLDGFVQGGKLIVVGSIEFIMGKEPYFTQVSSYISARLTKEEFSSTKKMLSLIVKRLGFENTPFHAEFRLKDGKPYLVEIAGRIAGGFIHETFNTVYGVNMIGLMLDCWLGNNVDKVYKFKGVNFHTFVYPDIKRDSLLDSIDYANIKTDKNIWYFRQISQKGDLLKSYPKMPTALYEYSCFSPNLLELEKQKTKVESLVTYKIKNLK